MLKEDQMNMMKRNPLKGVVLLYGIANKRFQSNPVDRNYGECEIVCDTKLDSTI